MNSTLDIVYEKDRKIIIQVFEALNISLESYVGIQVESSRLKEIIPDISQSKRSIIKKILASSSSEIISDILDKKISINKASKRLKAQQDVLTGSILVRSIRLLLPQITSPRDGATTLDNNEKLLIMTYIKIVMSLYRQSLLKKSDIHDFLLFLNDDICSRISNREDLDDLIEEELKCELHVIKMDSKQYEVIFTPRET